MKRKLNPLNIFINSVFVFFTLWILWPRYYNVTAFYFSIIASIAVGFFIQDLSISGKYFNSISIKDTKLSQLIQVLSWGLVLFVLVFSLRRFVVGFLEGNGGLDFFYYLFFSREPDLERLYPPGIFHFYGTLMKIFPGSIKALYQSNLLVVLFNSVLMFLILKKLKISLVLSLWAASWNLFIGEHFEAYYAIVEPFIVMSLLLAILWISYSKISWNSSSKGLVIMGLGCGLGLYFKQQAVFYCVGVFFSLMILEKCVGFKKNTLKRIVMLIGSTSVFFLFLLLLEPKPLLDLLRPMFFFAVEYPSENISLLSSLGGNEAVDPKLLLLFVIMISFLGFIKKEKRKKWLLTSTGSIFLVSLCMGLLSTVQLLKRDYGHYFLMIWPPLILASTIGLDIFVKKLNELKIKKWKKSVLLLFLLFPFIRVGGTAGPWLLEYGELNRPVKAGRISEDWKEAANNIKPLLPNKPKIVIAPPLYMYFYLALNAVHPFDNYHWIYRTYPDKNYIEALRSPETEGVLVVRPKKRGLWLARANEHGYKEKFKNKDIVLLIR